MSALKTARYGLFCTVLAIAFSFAPSARAVTSCGGQVHQNLCGNSNDIYPCCPNGGNCTWWAWEMVCRNWHLSLVNWGNANTWAAHARLDPRFDVVGQPVINSVGTATPRSGHVAWVIAAGGGRVTVTEENCCVGCGAGERAISYPVSKFNSGYVALKGSSGAVCACSPGQTQTEACSCGSHTRTCAANCNWGAYSACVGPAETCDGVDNDCNGLIDDGNPQTMGSPPPAFAATLVDSSSPRAISVGTHATAWAEFRNDGTSTWAKGDVWLAADGDSDAGVSGLFSAGSWPAWNVAATLDHDVAPGSNARFTFDVTSNADVSAKLNDTFVLQIAGGADIACPSPNLQTSIWVGPNADQNAAQDSDGGTASAPAAETSGSGGCSVESSSHIPISGVLELVGFLIFIQARRRRRASQRRADVLRSHSLFLLGTSLIFSTSVACSQSAPIEKIPAIPPTLTSVAPAQISARGGAVLILQGTQFSADTTVQFGDANATSVEVVSSTELKVTAPPLFAGMTNVKISEGAGSAELPNAVTVVALNLRFVQAPTYSLSIVNDVDAGPDAAPPAADAGPIASPPVNAAVSYDFDGDGDIDLVTCAQNETCDFLANDGQGNYEDTATSGSPRFSSGSMSAHSIALADFDGDGDSDVFVAGATGAGVIEANDGKASFTETQIGWTQKNDAGVAEETDAGKPIDDAVSAVAVGDLDGDGKPDLVVGNAVADDVPFRVLRNQSTAGAIHFVEAAADAVPAKNWIVTAIAIGDVDKNGEPDIIVSTPGAADGVELRLLLGNNGVFAEVRGGLPNVTNQNVTALAVADVNGDGAVDIIAAGQGQDRLLVNDGSGHFFDSSATSMPLDDSTATSMRLVDLDRDRDLDLVIGNQNAVTRLYLNDGKGVFSDHTPLVPLVADNASWVCAADVDGDSDQDLIVLSAAPTTPRLYLSVEPLP